MKPTLTYLAMLVISSAASIATFYLGTHTQGIVTMIAGSLALLSFQGHTEFYRPAWAAGIKIEHPPTGQVLAVTIIVEAVAIAIGLATTPAIGITARLIGLVTQVGAIGKISRDFQGDDLIDGSIQDINHSPKQPHP
jgi:hypothetical protein